MVIAPEPLGIILDRTLRSGSLHKSDFRALFHPLQALHIVKIPKRSRRTAIMIRISGKCRAGCMMEHESDGDSMAYTQNIVSVSLNLVLVLSRR